MTKTAALKRRNNGVDLPEAFPQRLESFREVAGLSWGELAACLGVDHDRVMNDELAPGRPAQGLRPAGSEAAGAAGIRWNGRAGCRGVTLGTAVPVMLSSGARISRGLPREAGAVQGGNRHVLAGPRPAPRRQPLPGSGEAPRHRPRLYQSLHPPDPG